MCKTFSFMLVCIFATVKIVSFILQEMCINIKRDIKTRAHFFLAMITSNSSIYELQQKNQEIWDLFDNNKI